MEVLFIRLNTVTFRHIEVLASRGEKAEMGSSLAVLIAYRIDKIHILSVLYCSNCFFRWLFTEPDSAAGVLSALSYEKYNRK